MKVPKITWEAIQQAAGEGVSSGAIYDWLHNEQPDLWRAAERMPKGMVACAMSGAALVIRALHHMPPDRTETLQDRLLRIRAIVDQSGGLYRLEDAIKRIRNILDE